MNIILLLRSKHYIIFLFIIDYHTNSFILLNKPLLYFPNHHYYGMNAKTNYSFL